MVRSIQGTQAGTLATFATATGVMVAIAPAAMLVQGFFKVLDGGLSPLTPTRHSGASRNPEHCKRNDLMDSRFRRHDGLTLERPYRPAAPWLRPQM